MINLVIYGERWRVLVKDTKLMTGSHYGMDHFGVMSTVDPGGKWTWKESRMRNKFFVKQYGKCHGYDR